MHKRNGGWIKGRVGQEFMQYASGRITREPFPLGGFIYFTTGGTEADRRYTGNDLNAAIAALPQNAVAA